MHSCPGGGRPSAPHHAASAPHPSQLGEPHQKGEDEGGGRLRQPCSLASEQQVDSPWINQALRAVWASSSHLLMVGEKVGRIGLIAVLYDEDGRVVRVSWHRWIKTIQRVVSLMLLTR